MPLKCYYDLVFCLDLSIPDIYEIKETIPKYVSAIMDYTSHSEYIDLSIRVKFICYFEKNYGTKIDESEWFAIRKLNNIHKEVNLFNLDKSGVSDEYFDFLQCVKNIRGVKWKSSVKSTILALIEAFKQDWVKTNFNNGRLRKRHIIFLFTNSKNEDITSCRQDIYKLGDIWDNWEDGGRPKRLLIFAPEGQPWVELNSALERIIYIPNSCQLTDGQKYEVIRAIVEPI